MRTPVLLLSLIVTPCAAAQAQSGPWPPQPAWLTPPPPRPAPPVYPVHPHMMPPPRNTAPQFIPGGGYAPLGIYANPLMIYAIRGLIGRLATQPPPAQAQR